MLAAGERVLVDASVAIKWVAPEIGSDRAASLLSYRLVVPDLFFPECANILWKKVRIGDLTDDEARIAAQTLEEVDLSIIPTKPHFRRALAIAVALAHPAYDAVYLAIADAFGLRIVTADERLIHKVREPPATFGHLVVPLSELT